MSTAMRGAFGRPSSTSSRGGSAAVELERGRLIAQAGGSDAARQLLRCFGGWRGAFAGLTWRALVRLSRNEPVDPNDPEVWRSRDEQAEAVLRRHGLGRLGAGRLTLEAVAALVEGQAEADREAGLDWSTVTAPAERLDGRLRQAHSRLPLDLDDAAVYVGRGDQRRAVARRLGLDGERIDDLSRWALANPGCFDAAELRSWRIGSPTWLRLADEQLEPVGRVERPVALFVAPAGRGQGWQLLPVLSLEAIRLLAALGGRLERELGAAMLPWRAVDELLERINPRTLHAGPRVPRRGRPARPRARTRARQAARPGPAARPARPLGAAAGRPAQPQGGRPRDRRAAAAGRQLPGPRVRPAARRRRPARRRPRPAERDHGARRGGRDGGRARAAAAAVERGGRPVRDTTRVGRTKGRPGMVTLTSSDGLSATTRRLAGEQALAELRRLKRAGATARLDAGARQLVRMVQAKPLRDDPVLLGRQRQTAALKVVGSGVDASAVATGKTISTGRALAQRAAVTPRLRAMVVAEGRLLSQWRDELSRGAPRRGLPPLAPNVELLVLDEARPVAGQLRAFDRRLGERAASRWSPTACSSATPPTCRRCAGSCWSPTRRSATPTRRPPPTKRSSSSASAPPPTAGS
jgi:hypothetical protein